MQEIRDIFFSLFRTSKYITCTRIDRFHKAFIKIVSIQTGKNVKILYSCDYFIILFINQFLISLIYMQQNISSNFLIFLSILSNKYSASNWNKVKLYNYESNLPWLCCAQKKVHFLVSLLYYMSPSK